MIHFGEVGLLAVDIVARAERHARPRRLAGVTAKRHKAAALKLLKRIMKKFRPTAERSSPTGWAEASVSPDTVSRCSPLARLE